MNVAIPGVDPWSEVKRNPHIWHFAFHAVPDLPEQLVRGKESAYFSFFFDAISASPDGVSERARQQYVQAYSRPEALHTGFEWYRAFLKTRKTTSQLRGVQLQHACSICAASASLEIWEITSKACVNPV